jgi:tRNA(Ile2)-agmatinylcytidine synthase
MDEELTSTLLHIGLDDTDSPRRGCTTYIGALLVEKLEALNCKFVDYPNLIRLNPNVPWKTRGNGAVCLRVSCEDRSFDRIRETVVDTVTVNSDLEYAKTDPAVVFLKGPVPEELIEFSRKVLGDIVTVEEAKIAAADSGANVCLIKGERGMIGALAAIGETLRGDFTYEIIAYRAPVNRGTPRRVYRESIMKMNKETAPLTFNNYDPRKRRILITPRGPDPILYGIRGETPEIVIKAHETIVSDEEIERWVVFRCNHGTDAHLKMVAHTSDIRPHRPIIVSGAVSSVPRTIPGGHVVFRLEDQTGFVDCAAYEPTGEFREAVRQLTPGDMIEAFGGVREASSKNPVTINLEKIRILRLAAKIRYLNPLCSACGKRTESSGRNQGFRCPKCSRTFPPHARILESERRDLEERLYIPPPRAHRHLTKPYSRYGREKNIQPEPPSVGWHYP